MCSHFEGSLRGNPAMTSGQQIQKFLRSRPQNACQLRRCFSKPSSGLDCGIRSCLQTSTKVWSCFDALSNRYHQSVFQQVLLLTIDILLWSSLLHLLLFTNQSPYRRRCCVCVFAEHLRWHRLVSLGFEHVPPSSQWPPFLLSVSPTAVCFCHPILQILCTQVDLLFSSSKLSFMWLWYRVGWGHFPDFLLLLSFTLPHCKKCLVR